MHKQFLAEKFAEKWAKDNKEMIEDLTYLASEVTFFNLSWGKWLTLAPCEIKEDIGRNLGIGSMEELFDPQLKVKIKKIIKRKN